MVKSKLDKTKVFVENCKKIEELCKEIGTTCFCVIDSPDSESIATIVNMEGEHDGVKLAGLEKVLTLSLFNILPQRNDTDDFLDVTQGKADFAYLLCLDLLQHLLAIGATDFADIRESISPDGDDSPWITPEDVEYAIMCEEPASILADEDESDVNDEAVAELEKFLEKVSKQKKGKSFKTRNGEVVEVQGGKLSKEESEKLVNTLKELFGDK